VNVSLQIEASGSGTMHHAAPVPGRFDLSGTVHGEATVTALLIPKVSGALKM
jgi:hypothetical protein